MAESSQWTVESMEQDARDKLRSMFDHPLLFDRDSYAQMYDLRYLAKKNLPVLDCHGNKYELSKDFFVNQGFTKSYR